MDNINNWSVFYNLSYLDYIVIEKALIYYSAECSCLNKDNVEQTLSKIKKILRR